MYLRTHKVASSTIVEHLKLCETHPSAPTCLKVLKKTEPAKLEAMWRDYFVFGVARNPWARAVSAYQWAYHWLKNRTEVDCGILDWGTFCRFVGTHVHPCT